MTIAALLKASIFIKKIIIMWCLLPFITFLRIMILYCDFITNKTIFEVKLYFLFGYNYAIIFSVSSNS